MNKTEVLEVLNMVSDYIGILKVFIKNDEKKQSIENVIKYDIIEKLENILKEV